MLCKLCKNGPVQTCKAQISAVSALLCTLCTGSALQSLQKMAVFCALQLCKLCTLINKGKGLLQSPLSHSFIRRARFA